MKITQLEQTIGLRPTTQHNISLLHDSEQHNLNYNSIKANLKTKHLNTCII